MANKYFDYLPEHQAKLEKLTGLKKINEQIKVFRETLDTMPVPITATTRIFTESTLKRIALIHQFDVSYMNFNDMIKAMGKAGILPRNLEDLMHGIRKSGNKAAHGEVITVHEAEQGLKNLDTLFRMLLGKTSHNINDEIRVITYNTFDRKIIYIQSANNETGLWLAYDGLEKIGDTSVPDDWEADFSKNSEYLREHAKLRINQYMNTAGVPYNLHWVELAVDKNRQFFRDHKVHEVLRRSGIHSVELGKDENGKSNEWFRISVDDAKKAIEAVKLGKDFIMSDKPSAEVPRIVLRQEQLEAIKQTIKIFKTKNEMLWNAKMRFGKTLSALQLVKESEFKKVLIMTHRPVVGDGWQKDFNKLFSKDEYIYGSKNNGSTIKNLVNEEKPFIYFASIQDLRGSTWAGGKQGDKNHEFLEIQWDLIIIDEAHEGNETELANNVKDGLKNENTKILELSGTPFNLMDKYDDDNVFTWDYTMEQEAKQNWEIDRPNEPNPYEGLPKVSMYTFEVPNSQNYLDDAKSFNFKEFFRVDENGELIHRSDVNKFLTLITTESTETKYPFSNEMFRHNLRHTLWLLPGVKEANALEKELKKHPIFSQYKIANVVATDTTETEFASENDLQLVRDAIGEDPSATKTITLTVRKLTTGVNVEEWSGVFFLNNTESPTTYLQAAFRAQTPFNHEKMGVKRNCYIFDFAPDRALKIMSESVGLTSKKGKINTTEQKEKLENLLNFLPILGQAGNVMKEYSVDKMMTQLKKVFAEKAVRSGFEDSSLYNDELMKLNDVDLQDFEKLSGIVGKHEAKKNSFIEISENGLTDEQREQAELAERKPTKQRTEEEKDAITELQALRKQKRDMISVLRGVSIRIPMMIYGMPNVELNDDIGIDTFIKLVDEKSWEEFMPKGFTKQMFKRFSKYYDADVFIEAGKIIRRRAKSYDELDVLTRTEKIAELFSTFKNPDKETVLTPWRVVNMQIVSTLGGLSYFDENFEYTTIDGGTALHWVDKEAGANVYQKDAKILDINSKTGLYPLFAATSLYYKLMGEASNEGKFNANEIWESVLAENIFALAKTPMAKTITERTLTGYKGYKTNVEFIDELVPMLKDSISTGVEKIKEVFGVKFDVVIGNPPYQESRDGSKDIPLYHLFMDTAYEIAGKAVLITPARFLFNAGETPKPWNRKMLADEHLKVGFF